MLLDKNILKTSFYDIVNNQNKFEFKTVLTIDKHFLKDKNASLFSISITKIEKIVVICGKFS